MGSRWDNKGTYGRMIRKLVQRQLKQLDKEKNNDRALQISHNIGYLISIARDLIKDQDIVSLEKRLQALERRDRL